MHNRSNGNPGLSRRQLLKHGACSAAGIAGLHALWNLGLVSSAAAQGPGSVNDYKALVCVFLYGGNDSYNLLVPRDGTHYNVYAATRQNLAIPQGNLLPITPNTSDGSQYGLHPSCTQMKSLFDAGRLAFVANVGSLSYPMTKTQYLNDSVARPPQLFSHYDQQFQWMTSITDSNQGFGWGGRVAELLHTLNGSSALSMNITLLGANTFQVGPTVAPFSMGTGGPQGLAGFWGQQGQRRYLAFQQLLNRQTPNLFEKAFADTQKRAIDTNALLESALSGAAPLATAFPDSYLGAQLAMIARTIQVRDQLGVHRQVFFCGIGGFDSHDNQNQDQPGLFADLSASLGAFQAAMAELGTENLVTTFTSSDFGRTLTSNGDGSDHAWGGIQLVMGGNVLGKEIYGTYPSLALDGPDDIEGGRLVPTTSVDEYSATLAKWLGVQPGDMATVFPNLSRFAHPDLGFMS
ncbi:MAG: DUF1501 domain-containing protein [Planctomycetes bacterium]|nr:DUF1501 domain-containing protein [Planctomycetota bacterium]